MTDLSVKYFSSGMTGAPQIANNWGDLVTMLDALSFWVIHPIAKDRSLICLFRPLYRLKQELSEGHTIEYIIFKHKAYIIITDELLDIDQVRQDLEKLQLGEIQV